MDKTTKELIKIYKPMTLDWLNFKITTQNHLTYHHIDKCEIGGKKTIENGALLTVIGHRYLHIIECKENKLYYAINKMLKLINTQKAPPTQEQREIIEYLLNEFYNLHKEDKNARGKTLIKADYLKRW